jgi:hypothetical protein
MDRTAWAGVPIYRRFHDAHVRLPQLGRQHRDGVAAWLNERNGWALLAQGGQASVYLWREALGPRANVAAIKVGDPQQLRQEFAIHCWIHSQVKQGRAPHEYFLLAYDITAADTQLWMPFAAFGSLWQLMQRRLDVGSGPFGPAEALTIYRLLLQRVIALHAIGVVHGDLKPGNLLLGERGMMIADFGSAHLLKDLPHGNGGPFTGTEAFMSVARRVPGRPTSGLPSIADDLVACHHVYYWLRTGTLWPIDAATDPPPPTSPNSDLLPCANDAALLTHTVLMSLLWPDGWTLLDVP